MILAPATGLPASSSTVPVSLDSGSRKTSNSSSSFAQSSFLREKPLARTTTVPLPKARRRELGPALGVGAGGDAVVPRAVAIAPLEAAPAPRSGSP